MVLGVTTFPDNLPRANRPVLATAKGPSAQGSALWESLTRPSFRMQRRHWTDLNVHRARNRWAPRECGWKRGDKLLTLSEHCSRRQAENGRRSAPAVALRASPAAGAPLLRPRRRCPPPPSLPTPQPPPGTTSVALSSRRSPGPSPGRGPPRRSGLDKLAFSWGLPEASGYAGGVSLLHCAAAIGASWRERHDRREVVVRSASSQPSGRAKTAPTGSSSRPMNSQGCVVP